MMESYYWNQEIYQNFFHTLQAKQEKDYQKFHSKLIREDREVIGIKTPELKKIACEIAKTDVDSFIRMNPHRYYEEILLHGLVLGYLKVPFSQVLVYLEHFMQYNTNWAINDLVCSNLKIFKKHQEEGYVFLQGYLRSSDPWKIRFALTLLLDYYLEERYIDEILNFCKQKYPDHYYVKMALAWLLSVCYIKFPEKTIPLLENKEVEEWILRKTISKICDSRRVGWQEKDYLKTLR